MVQTAAIDTVNGRPMLVIDGQPTSEFWCYGDPNAIDDFARGGLRICQFHVPFPSWWRGPGRYDFQPLDRKIADFIDQVPEVLLIPRVNFGYSGEDWWAEAHPAQLSEGRDLAGRAVHYPDVRVRPVDCWFSAGSEQWTHDACQAMTDLVRHCEQNFPERILGYQVGAGISAEWFRWWAFCDEIYEDFSQPAQAAFRRFLSQRYGDDASLRQAWGRADVSIETASVPSAARQHAPANGFFRDPATERDVIDWLECLSRLNASQLLDLCAAAKKACARRKLVGVFYGYLWPHWNTQNPSRSGHLDIGRVFNSPDVDYISSPYHYDNRGLGGFHHSETLPHTVERCGKLFLDEIDSGTHLAVATDWPFRFQEMPRDAAHSRALLYRDAASVLGTAGVAWWMDLRVSRWFADEQVQAALLELQQLARQTRDWDVTSHAEVALVIDDQSYAWCDLTSNLNQYFTAIPRQFEWSDLGFPLDAVLLSELTRLRPYRLYLFLNCWHVDHHLRRNLLEHIRQAGSTAVFFHGCGYFGGEEAGAAGVSDLTGIRVSAQTGSVVPEIRLRDAGHALVEQPPDGERARAPFGARMPADRTRRFVKENPRGWDTPTSPLFVVDDQQASVLGHYLHDNSPALALSQSNGYTSIFCGAPLLPGWLLARIARHAGVHTYSSPGTQVFHRGPLLSVYSPAGGEITLRAPDDGRLVPLQPKARTRIWQADPDLQPAAELRVRFEPCQTRFFRVDSAGWSGDASENPKGPALTR